MATFSKILLRVFVNATVTISGKVRASKALEKCSQRADEIEEEKLER